MRPPETTATTNGLDQCLAEITDAATTDHSVSDHTKKTLDSVKFMAVAEASDAVLPMGPLWVLGWVVPSLSAKPMPSRLPLPSRSRLRWQWQWQWASVLVYRFR